MLFKSASVFAFLAHANAFAPSFTFGSARNRLISTTATHVISDPSTAVESSGGVGIGTFNPLEDLVTREANVKPTRRTKATVDPFNPNFESIRAVPYHEAFPQSTKEHVTVIHEPTGHVLEVRNRRRRRISLYSLVHSFSSQISRFFFSICILYLVPPDPISSCSSGRSRSALHRLVRYQRSTGN